jgi:hypothetical protein
LEALPRCPCSAGCLVAGDQHDRPARTGDCVLIASRRAGCGPSLRTGMRSPAAPAWLQRLRCGGSRSICRASWPPYRARRDGSSSCSAPVPVLLSARRGRPAHCACCGPLCARDMACRRQHFSWRYHWQGESLAGFAGVCGSCTPFPQDQNQYFRRKFSFSKFVSSNRSPQIPRKPAATRQLSEQ